MNTEEEKMIQLMKESDFTDEEIQIFIKCIFDSEDD